MTTAGSVAPPARATAPPSIAPDLLRRARAGEPEALGALFREHAARMLEVAQRITGAHDEAEDVIQDVFVGLPEALRRYDGRGVMAAWLRRLTTRAALQRLRREKRRHKWHRRAVDEGARAQRPSAVEARLTLDRALHRLPHDLRVVYVLKEVEGYSHADIGELLGITTNTSEVRLHRARRQLRERLRGRL